MQKIYIHSPDVKIHDPQGRLVEHIAVYDTQLGYDYLLSLRLSGRDQKRVERVKTALYQFLNHWEDGERRITVTFGQFTISSYEPEFIENEPGLIHIGTRPANPEKEIYAAMGKLQRALNYKSPNAAALYQELQDTIKKYPTFQIKDKA